MYHPVFGQITCGHGSDPQMHFERRQKDPKPLSVDPFLSSEFTGPAIPSKITGMNRKLDQA